MHQTKKIPRILLGNQPALKPVLKPKYGLLKIFLLLVLGALGSSSCGEDSDNLPSHIDKCEVLSLQNEYFASLRNEQRLSGKKREDYYPVRFSSDFKRDYGADISPTEEDYDIARKVSRSVFEIVSSRGTGTGWLVAPRYVITAAHVVSNTSGEKIVIHTFDGDTIEVEKVVYHEPRNDEGIGNDLALLHLTRGIDAVPLKIADKNPGKNDFLMAMGTPPIRRGLGGWAVSAGPALVVVEDQNWLPLHHAVPVAPGMSGGPVFNRMGQVVSIMAVGNSGRKQVYTDPPERLWIYAFVQERPDHHTYGPSPMQLREVLGKIPFGEQPDNAGDYRDDNEWTKTENEFGDEYSPFPLDWFDHMQDVYKEARKAALTVRSDDGYGSGFIYDDDTVVTVGHVATKKDGRATITTEDGGSYDGTVIKTQYQKHKSQGCDIAVIKMDEAGALSEYPKLKMADSSSLQCGDPLVAIGSANVYNAAGPLQGVGAVYILTEAYVSEFKSNFIAGGMSGGPIVDKNGKVVSLSSANAGYAKGRIGPGLLYIHTRIPHYPIVDFSYGPNTEIIKRFVEEDGFYCPPE